MPKVQREVLSRPPWERMMRVHQLIKNGQFPNCRALAREFEVSTPRSCVPKPWLIAYGVPQPNW